MVVSTEFRVIGLVCILVVGRLESSKRTDFNHAFFQLLAFPLLTAIHLLRTICAGARLFCEKGRRLEKTCDYRSDTTNWSDFLKQCGNSISRGWDASINQFYAKDEFQQIKDYIGRPQKDYRVASIGIHPSISQENGFYTLDGYVNSYPLSYKAKFREIIAPELAKSPTLREYYDGWGNRVYIFVAELGKNYLFDKHSTKHIKNLELNTQAFKDMGGEYIFSALPIDNAAANHLHLEKVFDDKQAAWKIYLYRAE